MTFPRGLERVGRQHQVHGRRTTIVLEAAYWDALERAAGEVGRPVREIVSEVAGSVSGRSGGMGKSFNRAIRTWVVDLFRRKLEREERMEKE